MIDVLHRAKNNSDIGGSNLGCWHTWQMRLLHRISKTCISNILLTAVVVSRATRKGVSCLKSDSAGIQNSYSYIIQQVQALIFTLTSRRMPRSPF